MLYVNYISIKLEKILAKKKETGKETEIDPSERQDNHGGEGQSI